MRTTGLLGTLLSNTLKNFDLQLYMSFLLVLKDNF